MALYHELEIKPLQVSATLCKPNYTPGGSVSLKDPAIKVMTDLTVVAAVTISPSSLLDEAIEQMKKMKVKLLFVTDTKEQIIGLITYSDLQGERPIQFQQSNGVSRNEICVLDIMTSIDKVDVIDWSVVEKSRVGDIVMTMKNIRRQHALVMEGELDNTCRIRGIFSTTPMSRLLGIEIETPGIAQTLAEFERILGA